MPNTGTHRKRVSIGENEKQFVIECYNLCHGKEWTYGCSQKKGLWRRFTRARRGFVPGTVHRKRDAENEEYRLECSTLA